MEGSAPQARTWRLWPLVLLGLFAWQGWMTWCLLGGWGLFDVRPILSGFHAQHLYLGTLGAQSLRSTGRSSCYDPAFQAGYPKTPIFNGSRLAEVFLFLTGGTYHPAAYKVGLASLLLLVPWLLILAARGIGLDWSATSWATTVSLLVFWGPCGYEAIESGAAELLLGALAVLANMGMLFRFHKNPGMLSWLGLVFTAFLGWFAQPMLFPIALPLFLVYYLHVGHQHTTLLWHVSLLLGLAISVALNLTWLVDWVIYWWLRQSLPVGGGILSHRTLQTLWNAPLWGGPTDRALGLFLLISAAVGILAFPRSQRPVARVFNLGTGGLFLLALLGISWEPLGSLGTAGLLAPALWFASLPAAYAWTQGYGWLCRKIGTGRILLLTVVFLTLFGVLTQENWEPLGRRLLGTRPLQLDLGPERETLVEAIKTYTTPQARILWEDLPRPRTAAHWSALLPILTDRAYIGGLDPDATIEHATIGLVDQNLSGQQISTWSDQALAEYCRQYNIGWVVCFSPSTIKRFSAWSEAEKTLPVHDGVDGFLFTIKRSPSFALQGQAQVIHADSHHITLADVVPDNGAVVLSLHFQSGMRTYPSRVRLERDPHTQDPIGFLRLRVAGPAARVTLIWGDR